MKLIEWEVNGDDYQEQIIIPEPWKVTLINTGANNMTDGRFKRGKDFLNNGSFCVTYKTGRKYADNFKKTMRIVFDDCLEQWNYRAILRKT